MPISYFSVEERETDAQCAMSKYDLRNEEKLVGNHLGTYYPIIWKAVFGESRTCSLEGDPPLTGGSTLQYGVKKPK